MPSGGHAEQGSRLSINNLHCHFDLLARPGKFFVLTQAKRYTIPTTTCCDQNFISGTPENHILHFGSLNTIYNRIEPYIPHGRPFRIHRASPQPCLGTQ